MFHPHSFRPSTFFFRFSSSFSCLLFSSLKANLLAFFSTLRSWTRIHSCYSNLQTDSDQLYKRKFTWPPSLPPALCKSHVWAKSFTFRSSFIACFLALLSSLLSFLERGWVDTLGRSLSLIICIRSICFAVNPFWGKTLRGIPVLEDIRICLGWNKDRMA